jgi:hypothetical protein
MDRGVALEALIQAIPHIGGPLATLYFGNKQEKKFKRLQNFYEELKIDLEEVKSSISSISEHSEDELINLIEEINEQVENERTDTKKEYYKNLFKKSLIHPVKNNFNERKYFVDVISNLYKPHFLILSFLKKHSEEILVENIEIEGVDKYLIRGFINQLENYGLINLVLHNIQGLTNFVKMNKKASITELGKNFHYFCMSK